MSGRKVYVLKKPPEAGAGMDFDRAKRGQKSEAESAGGLRLAGAQDRRF